MSAQWLANFAPNLYWVSFTWFIPMLLGLICVNHPEKRRLLYPLFALAVFFKSACGYEYLTVVMLGAILFPTLEWLLSLRRDKPRTKQWFFTTFWIGVSCLAGFIAAFFAHSLIRGGGNLAVGFSTLSITTRLGEPLAAPQRSPRSSPLLSTHQLPMFSGATSAPFRQFPTARSMFWLAASAVGLITLSAILRRRFPAREALLLVGSWIVCASWFILAKAHSYDHTYISFVLCISALRKSV